jgi:peptidoglycan/LPS O-acetylase OafA/YrhL
MQEAGGCGMRRFYELDSLRGIAALSVVVFHFQFDFFDKADYPDSFAYPKGYLAVDLFFILSGVVLAYRYSEGLRTGTVSAGRFLIARLARLYPLHLATLLFLATFAIYAGTWGKTDFGGGSSPGYALILNLLLIQCIGLLPVATFNIVSWSISTELVVNALYSVVARAPALLAHALVALLAVCALAVLIATPGLPFYFGVMYESSFGVAAGVFRCIFGFMIGVLFYHGLVATRLHETISPLLAICAALAFGVAAHAIAHAFGLSSYWGLDYVIVAVDFPLLLFLSVVKGTPISWFLRLAPLNFLGLISYSIYLLHVPVQLTLYPLRAFMPAWLTVNPGGGFLLIAATILASTATYWLIEQRGRNFVLRFAARRQRVPVVRELTSDPLLERPLSTLK